MVIQLSGKDKEEGQVWGKSSEFNCGYVEFEVPMDIQVAFDIIIKKPVAFLSYRKDYDH